MIELAAKYIGYIVAIGAGLVTIYNWIAKPLREIKQENREQSKKLDQLDSDTADLLCSQLTREHDYYLRLGYCPTADKVRIKGIYERYKARKRNHLADTFIDDILALQTEKGAMR